MDTGVTFYLNKNSLYFSYYAHDGRARGALGVKVDRGLYPDNLPKDQKALIRRIRGLIDVYEADTRQGGRLPKRVEVEHIILEAVGKSVVGVKKKDTFIDIYRKYIAQVKEGVILNKGKRYSQSWVNIATAAGNTIDTLPISLMAAAAITVDTLQSTDSLLTGKTVYRGRKCSRNTVAIYMTFIVNILNQTRRLKWHNGPQLDVAGTKSTPEELDNGVYLNDAELKRIEELDLSGDDAMYRDAFLFGCQVGMRFSDLSALTPQNRVGDVVNINTKKTATPVFIPLTSTAKRIWDKRGGNLQIPSYDKFRPFIQQLGRDAGIDSPILFARTEGGVKVERWVKKWEMLGTHTCRRTFATNALKAGVPEILIMKATGHKTVESFRRYVRLDSQEHGAMLSEHPYFQR